PRVPPLCDLVPAGFCCATVNPVHFLTTPNHNTNKKVGALPTIYPKVTLQTVSRGRAQCQSKSSRTPVDTQDTCGNFLSFLNDVAWVQKVTFCQFGHVYQPLKPFFNAGECAEINHVGDHAGDSLADVVAFVYRLPRIGVQPLQTQRDASRVFIHVKDVYFNKLPSCENVAWVSYAPPA